MRRLFSALIAALPSAALSQGRPNIVWEIGGHSAEVNSLAYSPDGRLFASGSGDRTIKIWRADGALLKTLSLAYDINAQLTTVRSVAFSPDGTLVAAGVEQYNATTQSYFGTVRLWSVADGSLVQSLTGDTAVVNSVSFSPDGHFLASGSADRSVRVWSLSNGTLVSNRTDHSQGVNAVAFSADGQWLASGSSDSTVKVYRTSDWAVQRTLSGHTGSVRCLAFSPDTSLLASGSADQSVRLWNASNGSLVRSLVHGASVGSVAFSRDSQALASGAFDDNVKLWDVQGGGLVRTLSGHSGSVISLAFAPNGAALISGSSYPDYGIRQWDPHLGNLTRVVTGHRSSIYNLVPTSTLQLVSAADTTARFWRLGDGVGLRTIDGGQTAQQVALSPNGQLLAMPGPSNTVRIYRLSDGALIHTLTGHVEQVTGLAFSHDGTMLASGATFDSNNNKIKLWRVSDWSLIRELSGSLLFGPFDFLSFSPNDAYLSSVCEGTPAVWRVSDGTMLHKFSPAHGPCRFSPDGQFLAVCSNLVGIYRTSDWTQVATLGNQNQAAAFTPDGKYLALGGGTQIQFWRVSDWSLQQFYDQEIGIPSLGVTALQFTPDGRNFAFGRFDGTVVLAKNPYGPHPIPSPNLGSG
ncbi:MAG TPA: WD40 repeat domain-containing protein [Fimbriimonadaceae bacterium]|nr:WD40 repeat domain-containing protein [Fimbriimonadaceae bacterium]